MARSSSGRTREDLIAELEANARAFVERAEADPWIAELRRAKAEADATNSYEPIAKFVRRFKAHQAAQADPDERDAATFPEE
jgi:hypothetical protein